MSQLGDEKAGEELKRWYAILEQDSKGVICHFLLNMQCKLSSVEKYDKAAKEGMLVYSFCGNEMLNQAC